jgi:Streptomycin adenylyltransferase
MNAGAFRRGLVKKDATHMKGAGREADVIERLVQWANSQPLVRTFLLESSRASDRAPLDILSDYDVLLVVSDMRPFSHDETWLQDFGKILVLFRDQGQMYGMRRFS